MSKKITKKEAKEILVDMILSAYSRDKLEKLPLEELERIVNTTIITRDKKYR